MTVVVIQNFPLGLTIILAVVALVIVLIASIGARTRLAAIAISVVGFAIVLVLLLGDGLNFFGPVGTPSSSSVVVVDWISLIFGVSILIVSILVALSAADFLKGVPNINSFYALLVFVTMGSLLMVFSTDLLMIFVAWELMSIPSYVLTGFKKTDSGSNEASVKYFIISAFASAVLLYGISLIYAITGSTNIYTIIQTSGSSLYEPIAILALAFVIAGFGIKLSAVPFHMWIPDAYQGAPTVVSALLSAGTKGATFAPVARIFFILIGGLFAGVTLHADLTLIFAVLSLLSMTLGNFAALTQRSITRILAYSSIGQGGYILIGFASASLSGLTGSFFQILNYATMQTAAFLAAALIIKQVGSDDLSAFDGAGKRMLIAPLALTLSLLALGGFPPLNGFWSKLILFYSAINANLGWLAIAAIINSFVSVGFYVRIIKHMYLDGPPNPTKLLESNGFRAALIIAIIVIVAAGIYPYPFIQFASTAANYFISTFP